MNKIENHNFLYREIALALISFIIFSTMLTSSAYSGEFDLSEQDPTEVVDLPGTNMKGGMFLYYYDEKSKDGRIRKERTRKAGVLVDNEVLYYVHTGAEDGSMLDPGGDCNFGVHKDYFLMDCWSYGSSHNRLMYLFRFGKDNVELLDVTNKAYVKDGAAGMDFDSDVPEANKPGFDRLGYRLPLWMEIKDMDGDGNPEIKLLIYIYDEYDFDLYIQIKDNRLHVNLNPALYKPLFEAEKKRDGSDKRTDAYYIYGFLSGALGLDEIKAEVRPEDKQYRKVIPLLEKRDTGDDAFHYFDTAPPLIKYELNKR